ncbi:MAG: AAA family ATPase [Chloroflexi bacterium]|nr:AAA family ATPase [Chloroflexota bacterium]
MLNELYICDFAIIDELRLQIAPGFNVLTGETGAGKSIILDAVMLVLGGRADTNMVRAGCDKAYVEASFRLSAELQALILPLLEAEGLEEEAGEELLLARELRLNGRNICRVNGRSVSLSSSKKSPNRSSTFMGRANTFPCSLLAPICPCSIRMPA